MNKIVKIKSFTLTELTVTLIISSIVIALAGTGLLMVNSQYKSFQIKSESLHQINLVHQLITKDIEKAETIFEEGEELILKFQNQQIVYVWGENQIIRNQNNLKTDTFKVAINNFRTSTNELNLVYEVEFELMNRNQSYPLYFSKSYLPSSSINQMKLKENL